MDTPTDLNARLEVLRTCSATRLDEFARESRLQADERVPHTWLDGLKDSDKVTCWRAILMCHVVTHGQQIPREMQLQAVLADFNGLDSLISAGTGSGKTLPTVLKILLDNPADKLLSLTVSPLKRLQETQENDFNSRYGICTVVINEDTPRHDGWWETYVFNPKTRTPGLARHLIVTVEQIFMTPEGHLPRLGVLIRNSHFQRLVVRVTVDEAHNIYFAGSSRYGLDAFREAWGRLDELKAILLQTTRWCACSATFTSLALRSVQDKIMRSNHVFIRVTSNRPNTIYAKHQVVGSIDDLRNYQCFLMSPYHPGLQPRVLIFVDNKRLAACIADFLDSCLPPAMQDTGVVVHYHSKMSVKYLKGAHDSFVHPNGSCRIMVATSAQSVGVDFPNVKIVCNVGIPSTTTDTLQRGGRAYRNSSEDALFVMFYESWVHEVNLEDYTNFDVKDLDRPRALLKATSRQRERAPFFGVKIIQEDSCTRQDFAEYLDDHSPEGLPNILHNILLRFTGAS
ncbi:hypothetical protein CVT26_010156 [Gymnopilus dilepis]|uniref:DNA 3'-5' helicase n=1 Tax=Gymnopilus dilepis TaxID=231916 RepID=A0A409YS02_9AGAR|nr:hypothetical protein CVT26_010156 [Gymnopilus dilepis]